eukprot:6196139-Pleurochrysis_carterae.AAC.2
MVLSIAASSCNNIRDRHPSDYDELGRGRLCIVVRCEILYFPVQPNGRRRNICRTFNVYLPRADDDMMTDNMLL